MTHPLFEGPERIKKEGDTPPGVDPAEGIAEETDEEEINRPAPSNALPVTTYPEVERAAVQKIWSAYRIFRSGN